MDFPKKDILNRGYSFCHFQCCCSAFVSKLPTLPSNLENPFFQNGNPPFRKSSHSVREKPLRYGKQGSWITIPIRMAFSIASAVFPKLGEFGFFHNKIFRFCKNRLSVLVG